MDKIIYPKHQVEAIITGPTACRKTCFLTKLIIQIIIDFTEIYIYLPSFHQDTYQSVLEFLEHQIPLNLIVKVFMKLRIW